LLPWQRLLCSSLALFAVWLVAPSARADDDGGGSSDEVAEYREQVAQGAERFEAGDYAGARAAFRRAFMIHRSPVLLFNIASTYRREQSYAEAIQLYKRFIDAAEDDDPRVDIARETIEHLEMLVAENAERARAAARAVPTPKPKPEPEPEPARLADIDRAPDRDRPERHPGRALRWTGVALIATGAISLGLGYRDARNSTAISDELANLEPGVAWDNELEARYQEGRDAHTRSIAFAVGGGVLAASGAVLYIVGWRQRDDEPRRITIAPTAGGDTVGAVVLGSF
jgi:tetratricopeptide (TPR) repeat protein